MLRLRGEDRFTILTAALSMTGEWGEVEFWDPVG
jgi:hypothetical protein